MNLLKTLSTYLVCIYQIPVTQQTQKHCNLFPKDTIILSGCLILTFTSRHMIMTLLVVTGRRLLTNVSTIFALQSRMLL